MIFPVRCFTCGKPIGHLWEKYQRLLKEGKTPNSALNELKIKRPCCRAIFLTHVDMIKKIMKFKRG